MSGDELDESFVAPGLRRTFARRPRGELDDGVIGVVEQRSDRYIGVVHGELDGGAPNLDVGVTKTCDELVIE